MLLAAQKFKTYEKLSEAGENELRVAVSAFPIKDPFFFARASGLDAILRLS